ncbi:MAG TPA: biotin carboxylase N-terminal domain-containing protein, partial [Thermodesulfobacteriota bacterium]|nr:biotin carboxylase N-terminal domain-containing protein [Thermodesulfobacteriota bacterium]
MKTIKRVLVANRGEIAVRIIKACRGLGIESVVAVSEADRESLAARIADRAVCIGPPPSVQSYLDIPTLITAALGTGCQAIHPGYGFLAEQARFPEACRE